MYLLVQGRKVKFYGWGTNIIFRYSGYTAYFVAVKYVLNGHITKKLFLTLRAQSSISHTLE